MTDSPTKWHGRPWWQFVGVLVAAAALLVAVLQLLSTPDDKPPSAAAPQPVPTTPAPATPAPAATSVPAVSAPAAAEGSVRWQNSISFREEFATQTDLDQAPPRTTTVDEEGDIAAGGLNGIETAKGPVSDYDQSGRIAEWTGDRRPDFADCKERALAGGGKEVKDVRKGTVLCVLTDKGNIARLTITQVIKFDGYEADTVVWNANAG
ncbi:hypothetical protein AB0M54_33590 [Actinoplanes sp. NPDC051470]|uniref:hypothetical protein n=1 Tax=Actinoplanes sp. NPDC051470 TaxID=3157224 RepID=UPI003440B369